MHNTKKIVTWLAAIAAVLLSLYEAQAKADTIYVDGVSQSNTDAVILAVDTSTLKVTQVADLGKVGVAYGLASSVSGNLYVGADNSKIYQVSPSGAVSTFSTTASSSPGGRSFGLASDSDGNVYSVSETGYVGKYNSQGTLLAQASTVFNYSGGSNPIVVGDTLVVPGSHSGTSELARVSLSNLANQGAVTTADLINGLFSGPKGDVYGVSWASVLDTFDSTATHMIARTGLGGVITDGVFDSAGHLWATNVNNPAALYEFSLNSNGTTSFIGTVNTGATSLWSVVDVQPVPLPAGLWLLVSGLGALGTWRGKPHRKA